MKISTGGADGVWRVGATETAPIEKAQQGLPEGEVVAGERPRAGGPSAQAQGMRSDLDVQGALQRDVDKFLKITKEAQGFEVHSFWGDSEQMQTAMDQSSKSLNDAHKLFIEAREAGRHGDAETCQTKMRAGYEKLQIGLTAQGRAAEAFSGLSETRAEWSKFVRDAAVEADIALLGVMTGGMGTLAGRARGLEQLALSSPKVYAVAAAMIDGTVISLPHILPRAQDYYLKGDSLPWAIAKGFMDVGVEGVCGAAIGGLAHGVTTLASKLAGGAAGLIKKVYAHPEVQTFVKLLKEQLPMDKFAAFKTQFEDKITNFYNKLAAGAKSSSEWVAENTPGRVKQAVEKVKELNSKGYMLVENKASGLPLPKLIKYETKMDAHWIEHVKQHSDEIGRLSKRPGHDLIGKGNKFEKEIMEALGGPANIYNTGEILKGQTELAGLLQDLGKTKMADRGGKTVEEWIRDKGISGLPPAILKKFDLYLDDVATKARIKMGGRGTPIGCTYKTEQEKLGEAVFKEIKAEDVIPTVRAGIRTELARQAHAEGALHHQIFTKLSGTKVGTTDEFLRSLKPETMKFERPGQKTISVDDIREAAVDVVHAWRDSARGYKTGMSWDDVKKKIDTKDRPFSDLAKVYLEEAMETIKKAERTGIISTTPELNEQIQWRMRSAWVYAAAEKWHAIANGFEQR